MPDDDFILSESDQRALELLADFLPEKIFDMHMHIHRTDFCPTGAVEGSVMRRCGESVSMGEYIRDEGRLLCAPKKLRANMIVFPDRSMRDLSTGNRERSTRFLAQELEKYPQNVGEAIVLAADTRADIEAQLIHPRIRGLKCYHVTAPGSSTWQCGIGEYLPEAAWQAAEEHGLCITLHMVRDRALADDGNLAYIREMAAKYPRARLILAHAGRGFAAWTVMERVEQLVEFPNVYFDLSAVCEAPPFFEVIRQCGVGRVFWGSDYPVSMMRGKCISIGDSFLWLYKEQLAGCASNTAFSVDLVGTEGLLAVRQACRMLRLSRSDIEDIFYNNAMTFFGLED